MRTETSGNPTGVNKPMISLLIDVNETVDYKVKNYWTLNYYAVSKHCGLAKFALEYTTFTEFAKGPRFENGRIFFLLSTDLSINSLF